MKKKVVIIVAAVMAVVAIGFGIALGINLGVERSLKFEHRVFSDPLDYFDSSSTEVTRIDSIKKSERPEFYKGKYGYKFFISKSIILVKIRDVSNGYGFLIKDVQKKGDNLVVIVEKFNQGFFIGNGASYNFYLEVNKWDLLGVKDIEVIIEEQ